MTPRIARVNRLIAVRERVLDRTRTTRAQAEQALLVAEAEREDLASQHVAVATQDPAVESVSDLEAHRGRIDTLRRATDAASKVVARLGKTHDAALEAVVASRREVRKLEMFRAGVEETETEAAQRADRNRDDEHAARSSGARRRP